MKQIKIPLKEIQTIEIDGKRYKVTIEALTLEECICGCGRQRASKNSKYASGACKTRVYRRSKLNGL